MDSSYLYTLLPRRYGPHAHREILLGGPTAHVQPTHTKGGGGGMTDVVVCMVCLVLFRLREAGVGGSAGIVTK